MESRACCAYLAPHFACAARLPTWGFWSLAERVIMEHYGSENMPKSCSLQSKKLVQAGFCPHCGLPVLPLSVEGTGPPISLPQGGWPGGVTSPHLRHLRGLEMACIVFFSIIITEASLLALHFPKALVLEIKTSLGDSTVEI